MRTLLNRLRALPFFVAAIYVLYMAFSFGSDEVWYLTNECLYISPAVCFIIFWMGQPFKFCGWWKMQCFIPCIPTLAAILQHYTGFRAAVALFAIIVLLVGTVLNGIMVYSVKQSNTK